MDVEIPVLAGFLNVPTQTGFSLNRISKKKPCNRYCLLFKSSRHGIARLEICENKDDKNPKIFTLENCVKITQEPPPANLIQIVKKTVTLTLNTLTDEDLKEWVTALQTVAFCDNSGSHATHGGAIEEDNDLYCSSFDGLFIITLIPSEASIRCNIEPKAYMLQMTATELQLKLVEDLNAIIAMWPYRFIRKYGYRDGKFTFEAGRKCTTGEGIFTLDHTNPQEVFRCMSAKMKSMKKLISGDSLNSIDCGENQFNAAASMEPGSRSPLPPSPSNQHAAEFEINSTQSCISLRGFISSNDSLNNFSANSANTSATNSNNNNNNNNNINNSINNATVLLPLPLPLPLPPPLKHIPNKPPRKLPTPMEKLSSSTVQLSNSAGSVGSQHHCDKFKKLLNYEPVAITTSSASAALEHNKNTGSTVILKPSSPETILRANNNTSTVCNQSAVSSNNNYNNNNNNNTATNTTANSHNHSIINSISNSSSSNNNTTSVNVGGCVGGVQTPPDLPVRNESAKQQQQQHIERDYECIEHITDAWKTLGVGDVKHCERSAMLNHCDNDAPATAPTSSTAPAFEFVWQRSQSQRSSDRRHQRDGGVGGAVPTPVTPKIIDIDIGEGSNVCAMAVLAAGNTSALCPAGATAEAAYDRLDFLSPNNKTSSGYKTIVTVTAPGTHRLRCSPPPPNEYELIASPDIEICRKADDSHLGYGVLRKTLTASGGGGGVGIGGGLMPNKNSYHSASNNNISTAIHNAIANNSNSNNNNNNSNTASHISHSNIINNNNNCSSSNDKDMLLTINRNMPKTTTTTTTVTLTATTPTAAAAAATAAATTSSSSSLSSSSAASSTILAQIANAAHKHSISNNNNNNNNSNNNNNNTNNNNNNNNNSSKKKNNDILDHRNYNGLSYTIVSKPKRV